MKLVIEKLWHETDNLLLNSDSFLDMHCTLQLHTFVHMKNSGKFSLRNNPTQNKSRHAGIYSKKKEREREREYGGHWTSKAEEIVRLRDDYDDDRIE